MKKTPSLSLQRLRLTRTQRLILIASGLYTLWLLGLLVAINGGAEKSLFLLINLYLPQVFWSVPAALLLFAALYTSKKHLWLAAPSLLSLLLVFGPLMGLRGFPSPRQPAASGETLRVATYNIQGGKKLGQIFREIQQNRPDVLFLQEFDPNKVDIFRTTLSDWHWEHDGKFMIASLLPISQVERVALPEFREDPWKQPAYLRAVVRFNNTDIALYNTHFSTPREGLSALRGGERNALTKITINTEDRLAQGRALAQAIAQDPLPVVLGGDFNAPESSLILRPLTQVGFRNAFSEAGRGYGYTKGHEFRFGLSFVRIDHIYVSRHWAVRACYTGDKEGSDHRPMIAEVALGH